MIIAVTGHVEEEYVRKAKDNGMNKVFPKPFPIKEFGKLLIDCNFLSQVPKNLRLDNDTEWIWSKKIYKKLINLKNYYNYYYYKIK